MNPTSNALHGKTATVNAADIERTLALIAVPGSVYELRVMKAPNGNVSGYFDDLGELALEAAGLSGKAPAIYITLNPVKPDLLPRASNRVVRARHATTDADILKRWWLFIDFDPKRPAGVSSTEEEHQAAIAMARRCLDFLMSTGWPEAVVADSGNGAHLLFRVDLPNTAQSTNLLRKVLEAIAVRFNDGIVDVDQKTFNAARICKLYGTLAAKGDPTPDRPHRLSALLDAPGAVVPLSAQQLEELARTVSAKPHAKKRSAKFDVESWIEKNQISVYRTAEWNEGRKWVLDTCPWNAEHADKSAYIVQLASGAVAAGCHHNGCYGKTWSDLKALFPLSASGGGTHPAINPYQETGNGIVWLKESGQYVNYVTLSNFTARIISEIIEDDGVERHRMCEIEGRLLGITSRFTVPASQFSSMNWVMENLGPKASISPGMGLKDHTRFAIQTLSTDVPRRFIYTHTGWKKADGQWVFLHADGAIGSGGAIADVEVNFHTACSALENFKLPAPEEDPAGSIRASMRFLGLAEDRLVFPLYALPWRSVLGGLDFSCHLSGQTGAGKSEMAALLQQHFGSGLDARHLPGNWSSTANALESSCFHAKDTLFVVDDFLRAGNQLDRAKDAQADRLLRAQGNQSGRQRMRADATLRPVKPPRCLILSTGEDTPRGQSLRARVLVLEMRPNALGWETLTKCQKEAASGEYALAMSAFIRWLAQDYAGRRKALGRRVGEITEKCCASEDHKRTPQIIAQLFAGFELFLEFAGEFEAVTPEEARKLGQRAWEALGAVGREQRELQASEDPVGKFISLIASAVNGGKAHFKEDGEYFSSGEHIGWVEGDLVMLEPNVSYALAQRLAKQQEDSIPIGQKTLWKRMYERGLIEKHDVDRNQFTWRGRRVICVKLTLFPGINNAIGRKETAY